MNYRVLVKGREVWGMERAGSVGAIGFVCAKPQAEAPSPRPSPKRRGRIQKRMALNLRTCSVRAVSMGSRSIEDAP